MTLSIGGFATLIQVFDMPTSLALYRDVMKQVYLKDPDGYEICLQQPVDAADGV